MTRTTIRRLSPPLDYRRTPRLGVPIGEERVPVPPPWTAPDDVDLCRWGDDGGQ